MDKQQRNIRSIPTSFFFSDFSLSFLLSFLLSFPHTCTRHEIAPICHINLSQVVVCIMIPRTTFVLVTLTDEPFRPFGLWCTARSLPSGFRGRNCLQAASDCAALQPFGRIMPKHMQTGRNSCGGRAPARAERVLECSACDKEYNIEHEYLNTGLLNMAEVRAIALTHRSTNLNGLEEH